MLDEAGSGQRFAVFNTHLDRWGELARLEGARLDAPEGVHQTCGSEHFERLPDATEAGTVHHYKLPAQGHETIRAASSGAGD